MHIAHLAIQDLQGLSRPPHANVNETNVPQSRNMATAIAAPRRGGLAHAFCNICLNFDTTRINFHLNGACSLTHPNWIQAMKPHTVRAGFLKEAFVGIRTRAHVPCLNVKLRNDLHGSVSSNPIVILEAPPTNAELIPLALDCFHNVV